MLLPAHIRFALRHPASALVRSSLGAKQHGVTLSHTIHKDPFSVQERPVFGTWIQGRAKGRIPCCLWSKVRDPGKTRFRYQDPGKADFGPQTAGDPSKTALYPGIQRRPQGRPGDPGTTFHRLPKQGIFLIVDGWCVVLLARLRFFFL